LVALYDVFPENGMDFQLLEPARGNYNRKADTRLTASFPA